MKLALAALLLAAPGAALALEKCVGPDGKVIYSDRACPAGAKRSAVGASGSIADAQIEYYDVASPGPSTAHATWSLSYTYRPRSIAGSGCAVDNLGTKLDLKVRMPRWSAQAGAPAEQVRNWDRYLDALGVHEAGHLQTGRDFESNFRRAALSTTAPDCGALGAALRARFDTLLEQSRRRDLDYDAQTNHGATQGAHYP